MIIQRHELLIAELHQQTALLDRAGRILSRSHSAFEQIGIKDQYSDAELDVIDAYTSRFARATDLLTQRFYPLLDMVELLESGNLIDRLNRAEARRIIASAQSFREIRLLRNDIAHEYAGDDFTSLLEAVALYSPTVLAAIAAAGAYVNAHYPADRQ